MRGFQVAPAELEGHLLDHPDIADVCVVAAPDEYSGELPFAFVSLKDGVRERVLKDRKEEERVKQSIMKVRPLVHSRPSVVCLLCLTGTFLRCSMCRTTRRSTSGWRASSSWTSCRRTRAGSCSGACSGTG